MVTAYGPGDLARAQRVARDHEGGLYIWGGCSRQGSDCSGFMSILLNSLQERPLYERRFGTGNIRDRLDELELRPGISSGSDFSLGVIYPWESSSGIGHVAGTLGGLNVESRGGRGVLVGPDARGAANPLFKHHFHLSISEEDDMFTEADRSKLDRVHEQVTSAVGAGQLSYATTIEAILGGVQKLVNEGRSQTGTLAGQITDVRSAVTALALAVDTAGWSDEDREVLALRIAELDDDLEAAALLDALQARLVA